MLLFAAVCCILLWFVVFRLFFVILSRQSQNVVPMKTDYDISKQFQDDLIKAYNSVAAHCWSQEEAYLKAVKQPAPRYYVSAKQAAQVISPMVRGDFERVDLMLPNRRRLYYSLFQRVMELSEKRNFVGKPLGYIVQFAVISPAPEFFVGKYSIEKVRCFLRKGRFGLDGRVLDCASRERAYEKLKQRRAERKRRRLPCPSKGKGEC